MTRLVLDASAGVELLLDTQRGRSLAAKLPSGVSWWVPEHYYAEVAGALRRAELRSEVPPARVARALNQLREAALYSVALSPLLAEAWERRKSMSVADALYVILAKHLDASLVTADIKLTRAPSLGVDTIFPWGAVSLVRDLSAVCPRTR